MSDLFSTTSAGGSTVVPGFSVLGFRALNTGNQIWVYVIDLPGFRALFCGDGQSTLNPGTTVPIKDVPMSKSKSLNNENNPQQRNT